MESLIKVSIDIEYVPEGFRVTLSSPDLFNSESCLFIEQDAFQYLCNIGIEKEQAVNALTAAVLKYRSENGD
jgi:hypothetical protein